MPTLRLYWLGSLGFILQPNLQIYAHCKRKAQAYANAERLPQQSGAVREAFALAKVKT